MKRLRKHRDYLKQLNTASPGFRKHLLASSNNELIKCICEIVDNSLKGNLSLPPKKVSKLKRYKNLLRKITDKKLPLKLKKSLLVQEGGFLPLLLGPALALVGGLAGRAIGKAVGL